MQEVNRPCEANRSPRSWFNVSHWVTAQVIATWEAEELREQCGRTREKSANSRSTRHESPRFAHSFVPLFFIDRLHLPTASSAEFGPVNRTSERFHPDLHATQVLNRDRSRANISARSNPGLTV